jgi:hypothetical protein
MKLRLALSLAATLAFAMPVCATPTYDETPVADFSQLPDATELQDEIEEASAGLIGARQERSTSDQTIPSAPVGIASFAIVPTAIDPIPEPSTALLLAPAAALFLLSRRRK